MAKSGSVRFYITNQHRIVDVLEVAESGVMRKPDSISSITTSLRVLNPSRKFRILAVDDDPGSLALLEAASVLEGFDFHGLSRPGDCLDAVARLSPDVILLDVMMPGVTGYQLCKQLKSDPATQLIPVVMVTCLGSREDRIRGFEVGCDDFMTKPFDRVELSARVRSLGRLRSVTRTLDSAESVLDSLARVIEAKDTTTGDHCDRLSRAGRKFGRYLNLDKNQVWVMVRAGVLHDIGKVAVPEKVLLKEGPLDAQEWELMKTHPAAGADLLEPLSTMEGVIPVVRHHHEKWDGSGYPDGLSGNDIPYLARVFQILDIFDALCHERPYKPAFSVQKARDILVDLADSEKLDPDLTMKFLLWSQSKALSGEE
jgi:putative two-component system response regulator